jgi:hypothetical protein
MDKVGIWIFSGDYQNMKDLTSGIWIVYVAIAGIIIYTYKRFLDSGGGKVLDMAGREIQSIGNAVYTGRASSPGGTTGGVLGDSYSDYLDWAVRVDISDWFDDREYAGNIGTAADSATFSFGSQSVEDIWQAVESRGGFYQGSNFLTPQERSSLIDILSAHDTEISQAELTGEPPVFALSNTELSKARTLYSKDSGRAWN